MVILDNYDFLENLVKEGQADKNAPFDKNGIAIADQEQNPNHVFVFTFEDTPKGKIIWAKYGWTRIKNKSFLKFYKSIEKFIFKFNMPILRMGKNHDFANHTKYVGTIDNHEVYQYIRSY